MTGSIYAVAFDYRENMVYWSEGSPNKIMVLRIYITCMGTDGYFKI